MPLCDKTTEEVFQRRSSIRRTPPGHFRSLCAPGEGKENDNLAAETSPKILDDCRKRIRGQDNAGAKRRIVLDEEPGNIGSDMKKLEKTVDRVRNKANILKEMAKQKSRLREQLRNYIG